MKMKVGLIGGVSPFAFSVFYNDLCEKYRKQTKGTYPDLLIYSVKVRQEVEEAFLHDRVTKEIQKEIEQEFHKACQIFVQNQIEIVGECCNTLSQIFYNVAKSYSFQEIITPVNSVESYLEENQIKNSLLLATKYTNRHLYQSKTIQRISFQEQNMIEQYIQEKINHKNMSQSEFIKMIEKYQREGKNIILGCTDINQIDISQVKGLCIIDSIEIMVDNLLKKINPKKE